MAMDFTNSLVLTMMGTAQAPFFGIETQGIASWHLNK